MREYKVKGNTPAVISMGRVFGYDELFREIDRVASSLSAMGIGRGDVVMIALPNIAASVVATYAVSRIGAVAAMIHPLISAEEFSAAVKKQRPKAVFLSDVNMRRFRNVSKGLKRIFCPFLKYGFIGLKRSKGKFEPFHGDGEEPALYMQSGGTSGEPKTVVLSSRAVNAMAGNLLQYLGDGFSEKNRMLAVLPMFHGFGLCIGVHASLSTNMTSVLEPRFKAEKITKVIAKRRVTTVIAVPRMIEKLLACESFKGDNVKSLQHVFVGGDTVNEDLNGRFDERMRQAGSEGRMFAGYGLTETVTVCALRKEYPIPTCIGKPIDGVSALVVDEEHKPVPAGEVGELLLRGDQLMSGYLGDEEATEAAYYDIDGVKWLHSGDMVKADEDGNLYFAGRKKRLIKISGMNVFPSAIEQTARELDFVKDCVATEYRVNGKPYIRLFIEGELSDAEKEQVVAYIAAKMSHWNVPSDVVCVREFPKTKVGKLDIETLVKTALLSE